MRVGWFGVPWYIYTLGCLLLAVGYGIFTIEPTAVYNWTLQPAWRLIILKGFHSLVWILLACACFIMQRKGEQGTRWARSVGLTGLLI